MNYSQKKSIKFISKIFSGVLPSLLVCAAVVWFSGGVRTAPDAIAKESENIPVKSTPYKAEFLNPVDGVLTSEFGQRWGKMHKGIDIAADTGCEIYAALDGIVKYAGTVSGYGNYIEITHQNGFETAYAHCNSLCVEYGEAVSKGQVIAYVGSTGNSTGPHLHFEVRLNKECIDPSQYVFY